MRHSPPSPTLAASRVDVTDSAHVRAALYVPPVALIITFYVLAACLPIAGFGRLLWRVQTRLTAAERLVAERGHRFTYQDIADMDIRDAPRQERSALVWDIALVGTGLILGAAASIWSLFLN